MDWQRVQAGSRASHFKWRRRQDTQARDEGWRDDGGLDGVVGSCIVCGPDRQRRSHKAGRQRIKLTLAPDHRRVPLLVVCININYYPSQSFGSGLPYRTMWLVRWSPFVDPEIPESATNLFGDKFHFTLDPVLHIVFAFAALPCIQLI